MRTAVLPFTLLVAACSGGGTVPANDAASAETAIVPAGENVAPPADAPMSGETVTPSPEPSSTGTATHAVAGTIPAAFRGRWGMNANDCDPKRDDNKGLITISADTLTFYESHAKLTQVTSDAPETFTGVFAFSGEGQTWTRTETLKLTGSSNTLIRSDEETRVTYRRCDRLGSDAT